MGYRRDVSAAACEGEPDKFVEKVNYRSMKSMSMDEEEEEDRPVEIRKDKDNSSCLCKYIPDMSPKSVLLFSLVWNTLFTASQVRYMLR